MGLAPVIIEQFPGLDLRSDPGDSHGAIDLLNTTIETGRVRVRDGSFNPLASALAGKPIFLMAFPTPPLAGVIVGVAGAPGTLYGFNSAGTLTASTACGTQDMTGMSGALLGTPTATYAYIVGQNSARRWDGTTWTTPGGTFPTGAGVVGISPTDNRLAVSESATSKIWFSNPGDPTTFGANNFLQLEPGDGEAILGMATFNNQLFVFKRTKFFVFYGNSTDASGNPVFNYRAVHHGAHLPDGALTASPQSIATGGDAVYFVAADGIYRTAGGQPVKISAALDPFFGANTTTIGPFWQGGIWAPATGGHRVYWYQNKLFVNLETTTTTSIMFVYDTLREVWTAWSFGQSPGVCSLAHGTSPLSGVETLFVADGVNNRVLKVSPTLADDNGTAIVSRYRLPFEAYGSPNKKRLRETILEGTGTVTAQWSKDWGALTPGSSLVLGTAPAVASRRQRLAMTGKGFSLQIGASSGAWQVDRIQVNVSDVLRGPEVAG